MNKRTIILFTGGHLTPALATIDVLNKHHPEWKVIFIGRMQALEDDIDISEEYRLITERKIEFLPITTGRFSQDKRLLLWSLVKLLFGIVQAGIYILKVQPSVVVSFGGYIALPVAVSSWILRVPFITHEQTHKAGLTNKLIGRFAQRICVSFESSLPYFPRNKTVFTGLPIREELFEKQTAPTRNYSEKLPTIYITGGNSGAQSMNDLLFQSIPLLVQTYIIIHQTGRRSYGKAQKLRDSLPRSLQQHYSIEPFFNTRMLSWILKNVDLVIGRSGANTVTELALLGKIALFIPLPWSANNEQEENAQMLVEAGSAEIISQKTLTPDTLKLSIDRMLHEKKQRDTHATFLQKRIKRDGARSFMNVIEEQLVSSPKNRKRLTL